MNRWPALFAVFVGSLFSPGCDLNLGSSGKYMPPRPGPNPTDPPSRAARLSLVEGTVSLRPSGADTWTPAVANRPITSGDELWTDANARAELQLGFAVVRLDSKTDFGVLELSDDAVQFQVTNGVVGIRVLRLEQGDWFEIDTPNASLTPVDAGEYRISVRAKNDYTDVIVRTGEMEVTNARRAFEVSANQGAHVNRSRLGFGPTGPAAAPDAFDEFCQARDRREMRSEFENYASSAVIGAAELDTYGTWRTDEELGPYWSPRRVAADWAPYRFGRWAWIEPWGWTWIDDALWGFAPFHYGRWACVGGGWVWTPGKAGSSPAFAAALVAFVDAGRDHLAWLPLAPQELYQPAYRFTPAYLMRLNPGLDRVSTFDAAAFARQSFANRNAVTTVSREVFVSGLRTGGALIRVDSHDAAILKSVAANPPVVPTWRSLSTPAPRGTPVPEPPASVNRQVVLRRTPLYSPVPFEDRLPLLKANPGRPLDRETVEKLRSLQASEEPEH